MKKVFSIVCVASLALSACAAPLTTTTNAPVQSQDNPLDALGGLFGGKKDGNSGGSGIEDVLGGVLSGVLGTDKVSPERLVGSWTYDGPAVCFKSENLLQKAGGAAMAATIESKLSGYYDKFGLDKMTLTVDEQQNFHLNLGLLKTSGTVSVEGEDVFLNFKALGAISLGKMKVYVNMSGSNKMSLMFDITKLMKLLTAVGSATNSTTVKAASSLLNSYDGLCAGFKLKK